MLLGIGLLFMDSDMGPGWAEIPFESFMTEEELKLSTQVDVPVFMTEGLSVSPTNTVKVVRPAHYRSLEHLKKQLTGTDPNVKTFRWKARTHTEPDGSLRYWLWYTRVKVNVQNDSNDSI
jgi:hypothetical protein